MAARTGQDAAQMPFIKNLASSDRKLRTSSLEALTAFLSSRRALPDADARKLWTGLYYALWMTDRPRPQQALAADLAELLFSLRPARCREAWLRAFWHVLGAQWTGIEALRLNKFLLLVRRVWAATVRLALQGEEGRATAVKVCRECVLDGEGGRDGQGELPLGLRLHVLDVWVDELEREGALGGGPRGEEAEGLVAELGGMVQALTRNGSKAVRERARDSYEDERLPWASKAEEDEEDEGEDSDDGWGGIED
ncbi:Nucleolar, Nop52 [Cordyceps fumosorosea ARSEF 2679]|uniref:Nucleolar, Nop52 n=1 Tax=Cordyceps fumosorosea (strain ARSEF 2679) TaxID=1081104 RepID=A0A167D186_CORFA|nr:Nucleolar, Nop52 [Cordyceps fumosorosea ARSEF 2679]OAA41826.1 Nucleolar, Nop52 [Cordyceps fumosorosea ARSEF 2679]